MNDLDLQRNWLRGVLEPCLLALLARGEAYGYELAGRRAAAGVGTVPGGSLDPALRRRAARGLLTSEWRAGEGGPGRKYYVLTAEGGAVLAEHAARWSAFADAVGTVLAEGVRR